METRSRLLRWIGGLAGLVGFMVFNFPALNDMRPINLVLFALDCTLIVIWLIVSLIQNWGDRP